MKRNNVCHKNSCRTGNNIASRKDQIILFYRASMINPLAIPFVKCIHLKNPPCTEDSMDDSTSSRWFRNFHYGDRIYVKSFPVLEANQWLLIRIYTYTKWIPHIQCLKKLAETFSKHRKTVGRPMRPLGFIMKLDQWVPHQLKVKLREERISICFFAFM